MLNIVKRNGKTEYFIENKLAKSIYKSCVSAGENNKSAKKITSDTIDAITVWISPKTEVTTNDIRHRVSTVLLKQCHDAGYIYKYHRIMD